MKVDNFRFGWEHNLVTRTVRGVEMQLRQTICKVWDVGSDDKLPIRQRGVICSTEDIYDPEIGRRLSLTSLLAVMTSQSVDVLLSPSQQKDHREFRTRVWEVYRLLTKEPRWIKTTKKKKKKDAKPTSN